MTTASDTELVPFVLASRDLAGRLLDRMLAHRGEAIDTLGMMGETWFHWLWAANQEAFGDAGMPAWVQLDCATLPSGFVGFATPRERLDADLIHGLVERVEAHFGSAAAGALRQARHPLPVAAACQLPTPDPHRVMGISMWTLWPGQGLGLRSKALSLSLHEARRQFGVCSVHGPALRSHVRFGPLRVLAAGMPLHEGGADSIVYELDVPPEPLLAAMVRGEFSERREPPGRATLVPAAEAIDWMRDALTRGPVHVLPPARVDIEDVPHLVLEGRPVERPED